MTGRRERGGVARVAAAVRPGRAPLVGPAVFQDVEGGGAALPAAPTPHGAEGHQGRFMLSLIHYISIIHES